MDDAQQLERGGWYRLSRASRDAIEPYIVAYLNEGSSTIPREVMNPKMARRLLPGAFAGFMVEEDDVEVDQRSDEVVLTLRRGKPTGGMHV